MRLEARPANAEGAGEVRIRELVRNALRMRPDRIVVGEVRGPEALDMLQAMNTGHEGSLSTCHANSPDDALRRLETMVLMGDVGLPLAAVRAQLESALDLVVQVARRPDGSRRIVAVAEVVEQTGWASSDGAGAAAHPSRRRCRRRHRPSHPTAPGSRVSPARSRLDRPGHQLAGARSRPDRPAAPRRRRPMPV